MRTNRASFAKSFQSLPAWVCGYCRAATLVAEANGNFQLEWTSSQAARGHDAWEPDWIDQGFAAFLDCPECSSGTIVSGKIEIDIYGSHNGTEVDYYYKPLAFTIAPATLSTSATLPDAIEEKLQPIFRHIWNDPEACGGAIRRCVEAILDERKVPKVKRANGTQSTIKTHHRIEHHLPPKMSDAKVHLMALKWIGNNGAHNSKSAHTREELLDACEHLEEALTSIYGDQRKRTLERRAKNISNRRGKPLPKPARLKRRKPKSS